MLFIMQVIITSVIQAGLMSPGSEILLLCNAMKAALSITNLVDGGNAMAAI